MADTKLTALAQAATLAGTDLLYVVTNPGGTPASKKATIADVVAAAGGGALALQTLTDAATVAWDCSAGNGIVTLGGNRTMGAPTNQTAGQTYMLFVVQDATGSRTLVWNSVFRWLNSIVPTLSKAAGSVDIFQFFSDGTNLYGEQILSNAKAGPVIPTDIPDCVLWLRADTITGLNDGDAVTTWNDESGNGNNMTQGTAGSKPTYETGILNSLPVVRFDNTDDAMSSSAALYGQWTVFAVFALNANNANNSVISGTIGATLGTVGGVLYCYGVNITGTGAVTAGAFMVVTWQSGNLYKLFKNGTLNGDTTLTAASHSTFSTLNLGKAGVNSWALNGDLAEVVAYNRELTVTEREWIEDYLGTKYGL